MPRIPGHYEYDDDDLIPGKKKEGGLHQNLFDEDGNLKASARFIPLDDPSDDPAFAYVQDDDGYRSREEEESAELLYQVVNALVTIGIARATPHAKRLWTETLLPAIRLKAKKLGERRQQRGKRRGKDSSLEILPPDPETSEEIAAAGKAFRANMTSSEAQSRYLLALAARQFADEQMRILADASIQDEENVSQLGRALAELPPGRVAEMIALLEAHPSVLGAEILLEPGQVVDGEPVDRKADNSGEPTEGLGSLHVAERSEPIEAAL